MTDDGFKQFDRSLEDLRSAAADIHLARSKIVQRYVAMMDSLDIAFLIYYEDLPANEQATMKAAFDKLANTVDLTEECKKIQLTERMQNIQKLHPRTGA